MVSNKKKWAYNSDDFKTFLLEMQLSASLFRLRSSIQKNAGSRGTAPVRDAWDEATRMIKKVGQNFFYKNFIFEKISWNVWNVSNFFYNSDKKIIENLFYRLSKKILKKKFFIHFFFVLKSSEPYAKKLLVGSFWGGGGGLFLVKFLIFENFEIGSRIRIPTFGGVCFLTFFYLSTPYSCFGFLKL